MNFKATLQFIKNEFIYGGHLLSAGAVGIVFTAAVLLNIRITWDFAVISYLITYIAYAYNKLAELKSDFLTNGSRARHIERNARLLPMVIIVSFSLILLLLFQFGSLNGIIFVLFMIIGSLLYTLYFKSFTKKIIGFKSFYVSFFWASLVFLLVLYYSADITVAVFLLFIFVFLRFVVSTVFFDIKDMESDKLSGLKTLPVFLGKDNVLALIHVLNVFSFLPIVIGFYFQVFSVLSLLLLIFYFYTFYYLRLANRGGVNIQKLSYVMVDGEYLLWFFVIALGAKL
jgi:4-hydroxybenzoate polyprenyltransferase